MEEPNFKVHTDFDTPSGDASLLRGQEQPDGGLLNSTEISSLGDSSRPEPNLSAIITTQPSHPALSPLPSDPILSTQPSQPNQPSQPGQPSQTAQPSQLSVLIQPSISIDGSASQTSSAGGKSGIACDLCDQMVKSEGYLAQHRNKKKYLERQRVKKQYQEQLEASVDRMESLRVSESDTSDAGNSSKV